MIKVLPAAQPLIAPGRLTFGTLGPTIGNVTFGELMGELWNLLMVDRLTRTTFSTSRLAEFASEKGLTMQTGHGPDQWPQVIVKELSDNGIDAAEALGVPPVISIRIADNAITVADNGGGISPENVERILDFTKRVSTNEAYASPTRGRQGNAIQTVLAIPFVMDDSRDKRGETTIESRGVKHTVIFEIDAVRQTPKVLQDQEPGLVHSGTRITVRLPDSAGSRLDAAKPRIVQIAENYAVLNPHLSIALEWDGERLVDIKAADPEWRKWLPSDRTSAHWYDLERFNRLIAATIAHDQDTGRDTLARKFLATFRGMARSGAQKTVLDRTGTSRTTLATLFDEGRNRAGVTALLLTLKAGTKPVQPADLGIIGREHLESRCDAAGADLDTFSYSKTTGTTDGLPWVIEVAFAWCPAADRRRLITGCNWSPGIRNPFRHLDEVLEQQRVYRYPVVTVVHVACPVLAFTDRGKATLVLPAEIETAVTAAVKKATARWAKQIKHEERDEAAVSRRRERLVKSRQVTTKDAVYEAMEAAYREASDNGKLPTHVRQMYYAMRNEVQEKTGKLLDAQYVTQALIPNYISEHGVNWDVVYDDRGHLVEPHTGRGIGLGTLTVRDYLAGHGGPKVVDAVLQDAYVATSGAAGNYGAVLYVEKEGFDPLFRSVKLRERFDIAIMSTKGMSNTAARSLVENLCGGKRGVPLFVLHDFDKAGLSIAATLSRDTRRYQFDAAINVTDLGLRLDDITARLERSAEAISDRGGIKARSDNLRLNGATEAEIQFLLKRRVELNALTSRQLIALIERKLTAHGVKKLVPNVSLLKDTYRAVVRGEHIRSYVEDAIEEAAEEADALTIPATIKDQVEALLGKNPMLRWDEAVAKIARATQRGNRDNCDKSRAL